MITITFSPVRDDRTLNVAAAGDVLSLDGVLYDLGDIDEGDVLPGAALGHDMVDGDITRVDGVIRVTLRRPHGQDADEGGRFPVPMDGAQNGLLAGAPGAVAWESLRTSAAISAANLTAWRASARMSRTDFCLALAAAGILSGADAIAAAKGDIPSAFEATVAALPDAQEMEARIRWGAMAEVERNNALIGVIAATAGIPAAVLDAVFGWPL